MGEKIKWMIKSVNQNINKQECIKSVLCIVKNLIPDVPQSEKQHDATAVLPLFREFNYITVQWHNVGLKTKVKRQGTARYISCVLIRECIEEVVT